MRMGSWCFWADEAVGWWADGGGKWFRRWSWEVVEIAMLPTLVCGKDWRVMGRHALGSDEVVLGLLVFSFNETK